VPDELEGAPTGERLARGWEAAWSGGHPSAFAPLTTPEVHYEDPLTVEPLAGPAALGEHAGRLWRLLPDARLERTGAVLSDGRFLAIPSRLLGTHRRGSEELPATGRFIVLHAVTYAELRDERLHRVRVFFDAYGAAQQLGVLPARGTVSERALLALRGFGLRLGGAP
jgi:steroid delta-isomerase-like uncharacterized protein